MLHMYDVRVRPNRMCVILQPNVDKALATVTFDTAAKDLAALSAALLTKYPTVEKALPKLNGAIPAITKVLANVCPEAVRELHNLHDYLQAESGGDAGPGDEAAVTVVRKHIMDVVSGLRGGRATHVELRREAENLRAQKSRGRAVSDDGESSDDSQPAPPKRQRHPKHQKPAKKAGKGSSGGNSLVSRIYKVMNADRDFHADPSLADACYLHWKLEHKVENHPFAKCKELREKAQEMISRWEKS